jgi:hypothetical protein
MTAETFLEKTIRDQFLEVSVLRTTIRVLHHGGPENLGKRLRCTQGNGKKRTSAAYIEKCWKSTVTLKKKQTGIAV